MDDTDNASGKQVISRAAAVLRSLENQSGGLSLAAIARTTGLPRSTVQRLVVALEAQHLVATGAGGIRLGPALARLAASAHTDVVGLARSHIERAGRETRETVNLFVVRGEHAILVDQYVSDQELRVASAVGTALPLFCTAHGKALLADLDDGAIRDLLSQPLEPRTPHTIGDIEVLLREVDGIRRSRLGEDHGEHAEGVVGVGVSLRLPTQERYGLSIVMPQVRFEPQRPQIVGVLKRCANAIEASTGRR